MAATQHGDGYQVVSLDDGRWVIIHDSLSAADDVTIALEIAAAGARTTKNTDAWYHGQNYGISFGMK